MLNFKTHKTVYYFFLLLLISSCYEKQDGCLDINSSNYDFEADISCSDCCSYPDFKLQVIHQWNDSTLINNTWFVNNLGQQIKIEEVAFYLSEFSLIQNDEIFQINENIEVLDADGDIFTVPNDFVFAENSRLNYTVGSFAQNGIFSQLKFIVGINGEYEAVNEGNSWVDDASFFNDETLRHTNLRIKAIVDTVALDTVFFDLAGPQTVREITLNGLLEIPRGIDFTIPIHAEYADLLKDVDFSRLDSDSEKQVINNNLAYLFRF